MSAAANQCAVDMRTSRGKCRHGVSIMTVRMGSKERQWGEVRWWQHWEQGGWNWGSGGGDTNEAVRRGGGEERGPVPELGIGG